MPPRLMRRREAFFVEVNVRASNHIVVLCPWLLAVACSGAPPESPPQAANAAPTIPAIEGHTVVHNPDDIHKVNLGDVVPREALTANIFAYGELNPIDQETITALANTVEAPCVPCEGRSFASCVMEMPPGCENLPELISRSVFLIQQATPPAQLRSALTYPDVWFPPVNDTRPIDGDASGIRIEVWIDPSEGSLQSVIDTLDGLDLRGTGMVFRYFPDAPDSTLRADWAAAAIAAEQQGRFEEFLRRVRVWRKEQRELQATTDIRVTSEDISTIALEMSADGLDLARFEADRAAPSTLSRIAEDAALAAPRGVRVTPTWFVDGYRLRGAQSANAIQRVIDMERAPQPGASAPSPH